MVCLRNNRVLWRPSVPCRCVPLLQRTAAGTPSSAGLARNTAASPYHTAITQTDSKVVCLRNSWACSGGHRCPVAAFRFFNVPLRVRLRRRALRGTPLPRHTTLPLHRQTRKWSVCAIAGRVLAGIGVPSLRSASSTYRCGYAFVGGPCEEHRCLAIPHCHYTDRLESGLSVKQPGALAAIGVPSLRSASSTYRCGYAFVSGPCEEHRCLAIPHCHHTDDH